MRREIYEKLDKEWLLVVMRSSRRERRKMRRLSIKMNRVCAIMNEEYITRVIAERAVKFLDEHPLDFQL